MMPSSPIGPWCRSCGHPASFHGVTFCIYVIGTPKNSAACNCVMYTPYIESDITDEEATVLR